jgi:hypothetical protein
MNHTQHVLNMGLHGMEIVRTPFTNNLDCITTSLISQEIQILAIHI